MSLKGQTFHTLLPKPQVASNYAIFIPGVLTAPIRVYSSSLPFEVRNDYTLNVSGEQVHLPGKSQPSGEWTCNIYESSVMDTIRQLEALQAVEVKTVDGIPYGLSLHDVYIFLVTPADGMVDLNTDLPVYLRILRYAWVKSISAIKLNANGANEAVSYEVTFKYSFCD